MWLRLKSFGHFKHINKYLIYNFSLLSKSRQANNGHEPPLLISLFLNHCLLKVVHVCSCVLSQECGHLQSWRIPVQIPERFCCHPGDHSSPSVCPSVPRGCLPGDPAAADPFLSLCCALHLGNTPFLPAGHPHRPCQLSKSGNGQVCFSI